MPELPEVEITRRSFASRIAGARVQQVRVGKPLRWPLGVSANDLVGAVVGAVGRRGKYLLLELSWPQSDSVEVAQSGLLLMHLGMSGALRFDVQLPPPGAHDHFDLMTSQGGLRLHDPRRFGAVVFARYRDDPVARKLLQRLGPEPWGDEGQPFDADVFHAALRQRRAAIKQVLLQGQAVVGVGNIYASEALFMAGIHPATSSQRISAPRARKLRDAVCRVLGAAIDSGGSTLRDFHDAHGQAGHFQDQVQVYGREALPCKQCGTGIRRLTQGQRSTYFCPHCQKR